jgi:ribosomal protein S18 acetylase RimI-like enzyme
MSTPQAISISRASRAPDVVRARSHEVDRIFFVSSATQEFASDAERSAFRDRWLGRYLARWPECFLLATTTDGRVVGYLAGCLEDPAASPAFADQPHLQPFAYLTPLYPAHLHINVDPAWRGSGVGAKLVEAFCDDARRSGSPGVHITTAAGARNIRFYERAGFAVVGTAAWNGRELVMLGRRLD